MKFSQIVTFFVLMTMQFHVSYAQVDPIYKHVEHVLWVVKDLDQVMSGWDKIGFTEMESLNKVGMLQKGVEKDKMEVKAGIGYLGGLKALWIQPIKGENLFSLALNGQGEGAIALIYRVENKAMLDKMVQNLIEEGVNLAARFSFSSKKGNTEYALMDTKMRGKYYLGFVLEDESATTNMDGKNQLGMKFNQYAFAIEDPAPVSDFWASLDFPPLEVTHGSVHDKMYFGKVSDFDMKLGWQRHGSVVFEWCIPLKSPTVYADHIEKKGEGIQHFGFAVPDMDQAIQYFEAEGYQVSMSGGWGDKGKPGSGRFAYVDLDAIGGMTIELLWSYQE